MIKSIIGFLNGSVYKTNQTNRTIYLSNGTHWNTMMFHQTLNIVRSFINYETSVDDDVQCIQQEISARKNKLKAQMNKHAKLLNDEIDNISMTLSELKPDDMFHRVTALMPFGKYKGKRICDVALTDKDYLKWFFKTTNVSFDKLFQQSNVLPDEIKSIKIDIKSDEYHYPEGCITSWTEEEIDAHQKYLDEKINARQHLLDEPQRDLPF